MALSRINSSMIGAGDVSNTEHAYLNSVSSNVQTQINAVPANNVSANASSAYKSGNQSISHNAWTEIDFQTEWYDISGDYDTSTGRFTVPSGAGGKYLVTASIMFQSYDTRTFDCAIYINGSKKKWAGHSAGVNNYPHSVTANDVVDLSAGDYVSIYGRGYVPSTTITVYGGSGHYRSWFSVTRLT
jgi:hypothetical protein